MVSMLPMFVFPICLVWAALTDMRRYIIPNTVSLVLIAGFGVSFAASGLGLTELLHSVGIAVAVFAVGFGLWCLKAFGAGDVKLVTAVALWLGPAHVFDGLLTIALAGGAVAIGALFTHRALNVLPGITKMSLALSEFAAQRRPDVPYGLAIAIGALYVFPETALFNALVA